MDVLAILKQMGRMSASVPPVGDLQGVFAIRLAKVADKLTPNELEDFIQLGADIGQKLTQAIAVMSKHT